jgi:hypothetical protein
MKMVTQVNILNAADFRKNVLDIIDFKYQQSNQDTVGQSIYIKTILCNTCLISFTDLLYDPICDGSC